MLRGKEKDNVILGLSKKNLSLVVLVVQSTALVLCLRYSRATAEKDSLYLSSTVVFLSELLKLLACLVIVVMDFWSTHSPVLHGHGGDKDDSTLTDRITATAKFVWTQTFGNRMEVAKISVPAVRC